MWRYAKWGKRAKWIVTGVVSIFFIFVLISDGSDPIETNNNTAVIIPQENNEVIKTEISYVFDLEALYGKSITEIRAVLGEPVDKFKDPTPEQMSPSGATEWDNTFEKGGFELLVTYNANTGKVIDFFISTNDPEGWTRDVEPLKRVGNVANSSNYTIDPVEALRDSSYFTGIIITPKE